MKITTWNVNGYRAVIKKGFREWMSMDNPDILCLQEVKARPDQVDESHLRYYDYEFYWNPAERAGYSGVTTFTKQKPLDVGFGLGEEIFDSEGRVIWMRYPDFLIFNIYFPNGQRGKDRVDYKLEFYDHLLKICDRYHRNGEKIIITGDFNTAHREIDLANPKENSVVSGFLPEERAMIDRFLENGFRDVFREIYPDRVQYTWWTYRFRARERNIGWRLDYYLVSETLAPNVKDVIIQDQVIGSDHCPVSLIIE